MAKVYFWHHYKSIVNGPHVPPTWLIGQMVVVYAHYNKTSQKQLKSSSMKNFSRLKNANIYLSSTIVLPSYGWIFIERENFAYSLMFF